MCAQYLWIRIRCANKIIWIFDEKLGSRSAIIQCKKKVKMNDGEFILYRFLVDGPTIIIKAQLSLLYYVFRFYFYFCGPLEVGRKCWKMVK